MNWQDYDYFLPKENIALKPAVPRDSSKLFVYNTSVDEISFDKFFHLDRHLPEKSFLVLNNTKVVPARVKMSKQTGGKVTVLFLVNEIIKKDMIKVIVDKKIKVGDLLFFDKKYFFRVDKQNKNIFSLQFNFSREKLFNLLQKYGKMPLPLYLKKTSLKENQLFKKYQTIFAEKEGSAAAPTASLHFTERVFNQLVKKGIKKYFITLHIGLGTFAPLTDKNLKAKKLHEEYYEISQETFRFINMAKRNGGKLVAVGTTVTRALEALAQSMMSGQKLKLFGKTDLFILPPFNFQMVDILITNFHLPRSSLMMLVEAFLRFKGAKKKLTDLYKIAIDNNFRFYSFGDAMLIL